MATCFDDVSQRLLQPLDALTGGLQGVVLARDGRLQPRDPIGGC
jgi:hypothetical protein